MDVTQVEGKLRESMKVHSVSEVDQIPFDSFEEIQALYKQHKLIVKCAFASNVVETFGPKNLQVIYAILLGSPTLAMILSIIFAIYWSNYYLRIGIPLSLLSGFMTNPGIMRGIGTKFFYILLIFLIISLYNHNITMTFLLGLYLITNSLLIFSRKMNASVMTKAIMSSELVLLFYVLKGNAFVGPR
jgi:hypothetical protein